MVKRMLIDATHREETRVVVLDGNRLEEFDFETSTKQQLKGNIYLAKVTRVEPSLQAAFVEYGGNRHGFLAFNEIHPDYYRIPIADRERLIAELTPDPEPEPDEPEHAAHDAGGESHDHDHAHDHDHDHDHDHQHGEDGTEPPRGYEARGEESDREHRDGEASDAPRAGGHEQEGEEHGESRAALSANVSDAVIEGEVLEPVRERPQIETVGGDEIDEAPPRRHRSSRHYKIQEVIVRRQIMLVQVVKEERGTKGAALTTYLSLAGRYCVLMPNTPRGGGVSRKITSAVDRKRLKSMLDDFSLPEGMAVIVRTAGMERPRPEIKRDYEYLLRLWDEIRELTLKSSAPALIHEEGDLVKRAIRDLYQRDIDEVLVEGEDGYRTAKSFMKMIVPSHAKRVQPYRDPAIPLFHRFQVETQLDLIHSPTVQLRSGGYIVINPTEALVSIDVNSGRSTRERHIEETALKTNLEASDEVARQVRLRDLAGLIVIDFIDMEESRNNHAVERRLKEAMKNDRARIQIGKISAFGLLEMSRQRLRPSLLEASSQRCPHCNGTGTVRSTESTALHVLRAIEEEGIRGKSAEILVYVPTVVALYILNQKREALIDTEARYHLGVQIGNDDSLIPPDYRIERLRQRLPGEEGAPVALPLPRPMVEEEDEEILDEAEAETETTEERDEPAQAASASPSSEEREADGSKRRRRRGRRRRRHGEDGPENGARDHAALDPDEAGVALAETEPGAEPAHEPGREAGEFSTEARDEDGAARRRRRRGKRGGRRHGRLEGGERESGDAFGGEPQELFAGDAPLNAPAPLIDSLTEPTAPRQESWRETSVAEAPSHQASTVAGEPAEPRRDSWRDAPVFEPPPQAAAPVAGEAAPAVPSYAPPVPTWSAPAAASVEREPAPVAAAPAEETRATEEVNGRDETAPNPAIQVHVVATPPEKPRRGWWGKLSGKG